MCDSDELLQCFSSVFNFYCSLHIDASQTVAGTGNHGDDFAKLTSSSSLAVIGDINLSFSAGRNGGFAELGHRAPTRGMSLRNCKRLVSCVGELKNAFLNYAFLESSEVVNSLVKLDDCLCTGGQTKTENKKKKKQSFHDTINF